MGKGVGKTVRSLVAPTWVASIVLLKGITACGRGIPWAARPDVHVVGARSRQGGWSSSAAHKGSPSFSGKYCKSMRDDSCHS